jgi:hypothetical protein
MCPPIFFSRNCGAQPYRGGLKKIRHDLCLPTEGDLMIVLAAAEKLKPGLYWFLHYFVKLLLNSFFFI